MDYFLKKIRIGIPRRGVADGWQTFDSGSYYEIPSKSDGARIK